MNDRVYNQKTERLRSPERIERLEVERVANIIFENEPVKSVLDIGTGSGLFAEAFHKHNLRISGVDSNPEMIEAAKAYLPDCEFKLSSAEDLPFEDNSFDITFMGLVIHETDDALKALKEAWRVSNSALWILEWNYKTEEFGPPLEHRLSKEFIQDISEKAGFSSLEVIKLKNLVLYKLKK